MREFRNLTADEIQVRPTNTKYKGSALLLLYKDARCDMNILDETVGPLNWCKRYYEVKGNLYCSVGIKSENGEWVYKDDCGIESNTDAEKGEASDAFKRACFNWGLGRELYTTPKITIKCPDSYYYNDKMNMTFRVSKIGYNGKVINELVIVDKFGNIAFDLNDNNQQVIATAQQTANYAQKAVETIQKAIVGENDMIPKWLFGKAINAESLDVLKQIWEENLEYHNNKNFKNVVNRRKAALSTAS